MIAEAQKAAKALEVFEMKSPLAQASLVEARKLIAEATQTIEKIENGDIGSLHAAASRYPQNHVEKRGNAALTKYLREEYPNSDINSLTHANRETDFEGAKQEFKDADAVERLDLRALMDKCYHHLEPNGVANLNGSSAANGAKVHIHEAPPAKIVSRRWVRGRLVEVVDGE